MKKNFKILAAALTLPLAISLAAPASAASAESYSAYGQDRWGDDDDDDDDDRYERRYRGDRGDRWDRRGRYDDRRAHYERRGVRGHRQIERRLNRLASDIRHARRNGAITRNGARAAYDRLNTAERAYRNFARNGLSRSDIRAINGRIDQAYYTLDRIRYSRDRRYDDRRGYRRY
ncbi:hypothetical protein [Aurantiacibacter gangjinensis]|uniref:Uncharacterized protein n=1 Tax=Aurantiacibacter gangjinensis TaxID=502682 RepID=A0A0G9MVU0_9SPHN|nr:hypothetical protein [Aurantiacibacter gangjinensis]APE26945.1 hypothetical protein BMF35_a0116 [Aurantiacibacter gangjinensis]KLE33398.1 hypothetical protein AAW01_05580 [Aurantiacibacter gangjinensis]